MKCSTLALLAMGVLIAHENVVAAVPRPWTPVVATESSVSVVGRTYSFENAALPTSVKVGGEELLAGPMRLIVADNNGKVCNWSAGGSWIVEKNDEVASYATWQESDLVTVNASIKAEFDGLLDVTLTIFHAKKQKLRPASRVWLEIPLKPQYAKLFTNFPRTWGKISNAGALPKTAVAWPFKPYIWLGNESRGLCWFTESDEDFLPADANCEMEVIPGEKETVLRIRFADRTPKAVPMSWRFGLQATPVKPFDRSWNANHVVHHLRAPDPATRNGELAWKTLLRPDAVARLTPVMDRVKAAGARTVAFHEDWIRIQNLPLPSPVFKDVVKACHDRGLKVLVYQGYELSALDPLWEKYRKTGLRYNEEGTPYGLYYRQGQRDPTVCYASDFAEDWLARAKKAYIDLGLDGYYLDGTICAEGCANMKHGCGWRDEKGRLHKTYPFFAVRKMMRALYEFVDARGGVVNAHQSGYVCPATLGFCHAYWDGEHVATDGSQSDTLDTSAFRAEFMGRNYGVACEFLTYAAPGTLSYENAIALTLLHDVLPRPCGSDKALDIIAPVWKALDAFDFTKAEWVPYWEKPLAVSPDAVKASVYRRNGQTLAIVSNLSGAKTSAQVTLPTGANSVTDACSGEKLSVANGQVSVTFEPFSGRLLLFGK